MQKDDDQLKFKFYSNITTNTLNDVVRSSTELYFNEHFIELRQRLFFILVSLSLIIVLTFSQVKFIVEILEKPVSNLQFFQLSPGEYFVSTLVISFSAGLLFSTPLLFSQALFFFRPALTKNEKNTITLLLLSSLVLFVLGLLFSYFLLVPAALNFFLFYSSDVIEPLLSFSQYVNFVSGLFFSTGIVFQLPIILVILSLSRLIDPNNILTIWRPMILFSTILGAVLTPSADPVTQLLLSTALFLLYFLGSIISIALVRRLESV